MKTQLKAKIANVTLTTKEMIAVTEGVRGTDALPMKSSDGLRVGVGKRMDQKAL